MAGRFKNIETINAITNCVTKVNNFPSATTLKMLQAVMPSAAEIAKIQAVMPSATEIAKIQAVMPSATEIAKIQASIPFKDEIIKANKYIKELKINTNDTLGHISRIKKDFNNYFSFEDIYHSSYQGLYEEIDFNNDEIKINEKNPSELMVIDNKNEVNEYPIINQKDVLGLIDIFDTTSKKEAIEFINFLSEYPYLATMHHVGKKIINSIREKSGEISRKIDNIELYRARIWEEEQDSHYLIPEMWQPPFGLPNIGRYNPIGVNYLYMTDSLRTAEDEVKEYEKRTILKVNLKKEITILDLSDHNCLFFEFCNKKKSNTMSNPREYLLPNFIAQCCSYLLKKENIMIEGFKYKSTMTEKGYCYVFFDKFRDSFCNEEIIDV